MSELVDYIGKNLNRLTNGNQQLGIDLVRRPQAVHTMGALESESVWRRKGH
jgi:hypothetical protein